MQLSRKYTGVLPAIPTPFRDDYSIDDQELKRLGRWLADHHGITALVANGHTGEVFSLTPEERIHVVATLADTLGDRLPIISGLCVESILEGVQQARLLKAAGASALLVMPYHHWLRFGYDPQHVLDHFCAIGEATNLDLIVHVYPAWTKASYSTELLAELARLPWVKAFKIGTREISKYERDLHAIRQANPDCTLLTCHDEYLLATMVQGVDGALVGFASLIPELITGLFDAVQAGDLSRARELQERIFWIKEAVYGSGEPSGEAHARLKMAMYLLGRLASPLPRPPIRKPDAGCVRRLQDALERAGLSLQREVTMALF